MVCRSGHEEDPLEIMRHSTAHVMADAVQQLYPEAKVTIGPVIEDGFFYDFDYPSGFTPEDLVRIESKMREIIAADHPFVREDVEKSVAVKLFADRGENYKVEIIDGIDAPTVGLYRHGDFVDLCKGPHVESTGHIGAIKLLKTSGAYWRGDENNPMLQRIYGTAFSTEDDLQEYLGRLAEAEKRDHRRIGQALDLFSSLDEFGPGLILWHPKGARIRQVIEDFWRDAHRRGGYELVYTPHIARLDLWKQSGHWDFYRDSMYNPMDVDGVEYELKPMNCPFHIKIFDKGAPSYRDLPIRYAELGTVYRYERSGVLHGMMRVRGFTQDDAHIFCTPDQLAGEVTKVLDFVLSMLGAFGFTNYDIFLSTRPEKSVGSDEQWNLATTALENALQQRGLDYEVDQGEGVFYGPKIDVKIRDVLNRAWQCSTIQVDFNLPERYSINYVGSDGAKHRPIMVHRALLGSLERFFGVLVEHYAGDFPLWLAPVQALVIAITAEQVEIAQRVTEQLKSSGLRVECNTGNEKLGSKIRSAELQKIPYVLVIGKREALSGEVAVRSRLEGKLGSMSVADCQERLTKEVESRASLQMMQRQGKFTKT